MYIIEVKGSTSSNAHSGKKDEAFDLFSCLPSLFAFTLVENKN
jgi:hypothetical protein